MEKIIVQRGWDAGLSVAAARLYDAAFGSKLGKAIRDGEKRIEILSDCFDPEHSYCVLVNDEIVGLAGFKTPDGSLTSGMNFKVLIKQLGLLGGAWSAIILSLFEREPKPRELVMDGIVVDGRFRGRGIGSRLLDQIISHAAQAGYRSVRLDVIDSNPRAKKLYETKGFVATEHESFPILGRFLGFSGATTMVFDVTKAE